MVHRRSTETRHAAEMLGNEPEALSRVIVRDRVLVDRCLAGEVAAWEELYQRHHHGLLTAIQGMFGSRPPDANLTEEIAARVWYAVVANNAQLLDRFDVSRGCRLATYLAMIAKSEASSLFRSERRRRKREKTVSRRELKAIRSEETESGIEWREFLLALTPREREFLNSFLIGRPNLPLTENFSPANRWQLSSRIHSKLKRHIARR